MNWSADSAESSAKCSMKDAIEEIKMSGIVLSPSDEPHDRTPDGAHETLLLEGPAPAVPHRQGAGSLRLAAFGPLRTALRTDDGEFLIGIPSAGRAHGVKTLDYLERIGTPREYILLAVQTAADAEEYAAAGIRERVRALIFAPAHNAAGNRNNLINAVAPGTRLLMLDDDIKQIIRLRTVGMNRTAEPLGNFEQLAKLAQNGFRLAAQLGAYGFGINPTGKAEYMSYHEQECELCCGAVFGIITGAARFDEEFNTKEDHAFCAESIAATGAFPQLDYYTAQVAGRHKGGCWAAWNDIKTVRADAARICEKYPGIVEPAGRGGTLVRLARGKA